MLPLGLLGTAVLGKEDGPIYSYAHGAADAINNGSGLRGARAVPSFMGKGPYPRRCEDPIEGRYSSLPYSALGTSHQAGGEEGGKQKF